MLRNMYCYLPKKSSSLAGLLKLGLLNCRAASVNYGYENYEPRGGNTNRQKYRSNSPFKLSGGQRGGRGPRAPGGRYQVQQSSRGSYDSLELGSKLRDVDWSKMEVSEINKAFYAEHPNVSARSAEEVNEWVKKNEVTLDGEKIPRPIFNFNEAGFPAPLEKLLYDNYSKPTIIQSISWPVAMCGRDMVSIARTGTGKTLGFTLPGIIHIKKQAQRAGSNGPVALVLCPTRELAQQVEVMAREYCQKMAISSTCLFGGASKLRQATELERGLDFVIATPGRLLDFLQDGVVDMRRCSYLVLDEADRMLDMGFEPQIRSIIGQIRPERQTLMFSATWPKEVRGLARDFQTDPVFLNVGSLELSANPNIDQFVEVIEEEEKSTRLAELLKHIMSLQEKKTLIFVETKRKAERDRVMREFREGRVPILLATDVASRGIDVSDIRFVINYDFPNDGGESYVHRIGRTGRVDMKGTSYTFFTSDNAGRAAELIEVLKEAGQQVPDELKEFVRTKVHYSPPTASYRRWK